MDFEYIKKIMSKDYNECVVGFVDILGFKDKILKQINDGGIEIEGQVSLDELKALFCNIKIEQKAAEVVKKLQIRLFSDCMYIFAEQKDVDEVIRFVASLQMQFLANSPLFIDQSGSRIKDGIKNFNLLRGGITCGNVIIDGDIMFGPGIIEAYKLESEEARYPRVVVSEKVRELSELKDSIVEDFDGQHYIDFITLSGGSFDRKNREDSLKALNDLIKKNVDESVNNKYRWLIGYLTKKKVEMIKDSRSCAKDFLLYSLFGGNVDYKTAAIDRAYVDMAAHTLRGFGEKKEEIERKWSARFEASKKLKERLDIIGPYFTQREYDKWHKETCVILVQCYKEPVVLTIGQAQKWLNMTIKYLYVMNKVGIGCVPAFIKDENNAVFYHVPLDSYILKEAKENVSGLTWSTITNYDTYMSIQEGLRRSGKGFLWELREWTSLSETRKAGKLSYSRYVSEKIITNDKGKS